MYLFCKRGYSETFAIISMILGIYSLMSEWQINKSKNFSKVFYWFLSVKMPHFALSNPELYHFIFFTYFFSIFAKENTSILTDILLLTYSLKLDRQFKIDKRVKLNTGYFLLLISNEKKWIANQST